MLSFLEQLNRKSYRLGYTYQRPNNRSVQSDSITLFVNMFAILFSLAVLTCAGSAISYNILRYFGIPFKSHHIFFKSLLAELAAKGHNITLYTVYADDNLATLPRLTQIHVGDCMKTPAKEYLLLDSVYDPSTMELMMLISRQIPTYEQVANCAETTELINSTKKFDAFIADFFHTEWYAIFANIFDVPLIDVYPNRIYPWFESLIGNGAFERLHFGNGFLG